MVIGQSERLETTKPSIDRDFPTRLMFIECAAVGRGNRAVWLQTRPQVNNKEKR